MSRMIELIRPTWIPDHVGDYVPFVDERYDGKCQELVRCKDCVKCETKMVEKGNRVGNPKEKAWYCYGSLHGLRVKPDWFCADGERRTE